MSNENWMGRLSDVARKLPIINLAIPGSHNSMTYGITPKSKVAPDCETGARRLNAIFPCCVRRWAITQVADATEQLRLGVRYFDLRVCQRDGEFYYCHGLYSMRVFIPLIDIANFLDSHPKELVILDFQHFYAMEPKHHNTLQFALKDLFGSKLYTKDDGPLSECTLNGCHEEGKQVIIIYRWCTRDLPRVFWPSGSWPTPWPNVCSTKKLEYFLDAALLTRNPLKGYVSQCIMTPSAGYIALRFWSSLKRCAKTVDKKLCPWIQAQTPGPYNRADDERDKAKVNVFIADFVNLRDGQFCNWVIALNSIFKETDC